MWNEGIPKALAIHKLSSASLGLVVSWSQSCVRLKQHGRSWVSARVEQPSDWVVRVLWSVVSSSGPGHSLHAWHSEVQRTEKLSLKVLMSYLRKFLRSLKKLPKIELVHAVCALQELTVKYFIYKRTYTTYLYTYISLNTQRKKKSSPTSANEVLPAVCFVNFVLLLSAISEGNV